MQWALRRESYGITATVHPFALSTSRFVMIDSIEWTTSTLMPFPMPLAVYNAWPVVVSSITQMHTATI